MPNPLITTTSDVAPPISELYSRTLLARGRPYLCYGKFGQEKSLKQGFGDRVKFRRYAALDNTPVPLIEGIPPTGKKLNETDITVDVDWYGDFIPLSDKLIMTTADPVITETTQILGEQAAQIIDQIHRNGIMGGTNIMVATDDLGAVDATDTRANCAGRVNKKLLDAAVRILEGTHTRKYTRLIAPGSGQKTEAIEASFIGIVGHKVKFDLKEIPGFIPAKDYPSQQPKFENEIGYYDETRFVKTGQPKVWADSGVVIASAPGCESTTGANVDVHGILIIGMDAYGTVKLDGLSLQHYAKQLGSASAADPINQFATSGWKAAQASIILNDDWMLRLEVCVSD